MVIYWYNFQHLARLDQCNSNSNHPSSPSHQELGDFVQACVTRREQLANLLGILLQEANDGELAAFASYAMAFPDGFTALVDTYEVLR